MNELVIRTASAGDLEAILAVQKLAYQQEAALYDDYMIPPLLETLDEMRALLGRVTFLKAESAGRIVGSVRAELCEGTCHIGRLIVQPDFQRRGIGTALLQAIEAQFAHAARYELFTGHLSEGNLRLYQRLGYTIFSTVPATPALSMVYLEKLMHEVGTDENTDFAD